MYQPSGFNTFIIVSSQFQVSDQDLPQQVQAGAKKKSNYFEREASEIDNKIEKDEEESYGGEGYFFARTSLRTSRKWKVKKIQ